MSQSIYIETLESTDSKAGDKLIDLVMLHGWAMHGGVMKGLAKKLTRHFRVHLVDLPGHGLSQIDNVEFMIKNLAENIVSAAQKNINTKNINTNAIWLGWSMGGLIATQIARQFPDSVQKLILLSSTPAFVKQAGWPHAVDKNVFQGFANDLKNDLPATIMRFLSLQIRGAEDGRQTLKQLRKVLFSKEMPSVKVLMDGLTILQETNLLSVLTELPMPLQLLGGERDTLIPEAALYEVHKVMKNSDLTIIARAGHAPFLSHTDQCAQAITRFCHD